MKKLKALFGGRKKTKTREDAVMGLRREFVYLDEVSVYSLVASRQGSIPEQLTTSISASVQDEISSSVGVSAGLKSEVAAKTATTTSNATQVVRKSLVQGAFKELVDAEQQNLSLPEPGEKEQPPAITDTGDLERLADAEGSYWVIDSASLKRGQLLELEVELDADPVFAFNAAVSSMVEIMDENPELFGNQFEGIAAGEMMNRILGRLLVGLVPLRCRMPEYQSVVLGERELLVHRRLRDQIRLSHEIEFNEVYLVGVAEESLFWKDLRRILFSNSRFTVMCRLGRDGLRQTWTPVKLAEVFKRVMPQLGDQLDSMSTQMMEGFHSGAAAALAEGDADARMRRGMQLYAGSYAAHFDDGEFDFDQLGTLLEPEPGIDYEETEARRHALEPLTERLREILAQPEDLEFEAELRGDAMEMAGFGLGDVQNPVVGDAVTENVAGGRFLHAEFVAIYW